MIGLSEVILIIVLIVLLLRPDKLPEYAKNIREAVDTINSIKKEAQEVVDPIITPVHEIADDVKDVSNSITETIVPTPKNDEEVKE